MIYLAFNLLPFLQILSFWSRYMEDNLATFFDIVYADMEDGECNTLDFQLGGTGIDATIPTRSWSIKVNLYLIL